MTERLCPKVELALLVRHEAGCCKETGPDGHKTGNGTYTEGGRGGQKEYEDGQLEAGTGQKKKEDR